MKCKAWNYKTEKKTYEKSFITLVLAISWFHWIWHLNPKAMKGKNRQVINKKYILIVTIKEIKWVLGIDLNTSQMFIHSILLSTLWWIVIISSVLRNRNLRPIWSKPGNWRSQNHIKEKNEGKVQQEHLTSLKLQLILPTTPSYPPFLWIYFYILTSFAAKTNKQIPYTTEHRKNPFTI